MKRILVRSDNERPLLSLIECVTSNLTGVELVLMTSPEGDHAAYGLAEIGVREIKAQTRILRSQLVHAANCVSRYRWSYAWSAAMWKDLETSSGGVW